SELGVSAKTRSTFIPTVPAAAKTFAQWPRRTSMLSGDVPAGGTESDRRTPASPTVSRCQLYLVSAVM
ncbi:hypothetical protein LQ384_29270, partial [Rhodococcus rhodochrous]